MEKNYVICLTLISVVSIISMILLMVTPSIIYSFPELTNSAGNTGYFMIFSTVSDFVQTGSHRNQGIFWEPGAFQFFLFLAYIFELSNKRFKPRRWILLILLFAMLSTVSTTGIIVAILLCMYTISLNGGKTNTLKFLFVFIVTIIILMTILPRLDGFLEYILVNKVNEVINYRPHITTTSSTITRMHSIFYPIKEFMYSPILGIGTEGYSFISRHLNQSMFTNTQVNWLAKYGIVYGVIVLVGIWRFFRNDFKTPKDTLYIYLTLMISISTEALQSNIFLLVICFQGYLIASKPILSDSSNEIVAVE